MSAVTVRALDEHLTAVRMAGQRYGITTVLTGPLLAYADQLAKAPRLVLAGHLVRLTLAALTGRWPAHPAGRERLLADARRTAQARRTEES